MRIRCSECRNAWTSTQSEVEDLAGEPRNWIDPATIPKGKYTKLPRNQSLLRSWLGSSTTKLQSEGIRTNNQIDDKIVKALFPLYERNADVLAQFKEVEKIPSLIKGKGAGFPENTNRMAEITCHFLEKFHGIEPTPEFILWIKERCAKTGGCEGHIFFDLPGHVWGTNPITGGCKATTDPEGDWETYPTHNEDLQGDLSFEGQKEPTVGIIARGTIPELADICGVSYQKILNILKAEILVEKLPEGGYTATSEGKAFAHIRHYESQGSQFYYCPDPPSQNGQSHVCLWDIYKILPLLESRLQ